MLENKITNNIYHKKLKIFIILIMYVFVLLVNYLKKKDLNFFGLKIFVIKNKNEKNKIFQT